jgi:hypothetical protein
MLDSVPILRQLREMLDRVTACQFSVESVAEGAEPEFMLVHDRMDGSCWLWDYAHGRRFLEATEPFSPRDSWEDEDDLLGPPEGGPKLLGP